MPPKTGPTKSADGLLDQAATLSAKHAPKPTTVRQGLTTAAVDRIIRGVYTKSVTNTLWHDTDNRVGAASMIRTATTSGGVFAVPGSLYECPCSACQAKRDHDRRLLAKDIRYA